MPDQGPTEIFPSPPERENASPSPLRSGVSSILGWVRDLAVSVLLAVVLIVFIYQPVKVEGTSMMPSLKDQERIFINKFTYRFGLGEIQRGDTVVFWYPLDPSKSYIKRVIGVPGDLVRIEDGQVYVNDQPLVESMLWIGIVRRGRRRRSRCATASCRRESISSSVTTADLRATAVPGLRATRQHVWQSCVRVLAAG